MAGNKNSTLAIDFEHLGMLQDIVDKFNEQNPTRKTNGKDFIAIVIDYISKNGYDFLFNKCENLEEWKDIFGYVGQYQISNLGRVRRVEQIIENPKRFRSKYKKGKRRLNELILTTKTNIMGEEYVTFCDGESFTIQTLVNNHF